MFLVGLGVCFFLSVVVVDDIVYVYGGFEKGGVYFVCFIFLNVFDMKIGKWSMVVMGIFGVVFLMKMFEMNGCLLFYGVDEIEDGVVNFVFYDLMLLVILGEVEIMSFSFGGCRIVEFK